MKEITTSYKMLSGIHLEDVKTFSASIHEQRERCIAKRKELFTECLNYATLDDLRDKIASGRFRITLHGAPFEGIFHEKPGNFLYIAFDGGRNLADTLPKFPRWSYSSLVDGSFLAIEDPMYYLYDTIQLAWYYGTREHCYLEDCVEIVKAVCSKLNIPFENVVFLGSSGGGYAALYAATLLQNSLSISLNPQLSISRHHTAAEFARITGISLKADDPLNRNNLARQILEWSTSRHVIIYNSHDPHYKLFFQLAEALSVPLRYGISISQNILMWTYSTPGSPNPHNAMETRAIFSMIDYIAKEFTNSGELERLQNIAVMTNEFWNELYREKNETYTYKKEMYRLQQKIGKKNYRATSLLQKIKMWICTKHAAEPGSDK